MNTAFWNEFNQGIMYSSQYWYLKNHKLFDNLSPDDLNDVCYIAQYKTSQKGDLIFFSNENKGRIFTLKKGAIKIVKIDPDGNEIVKDILKAGDMFGSLDFSEPAMDEYAIVISDRVTFCSFNMAEFEKFISKKPDVALKYTKWIGFWFKRLENRYANIMFKDVRTRFLLFLKDLSTDVIPDNDGFITISNYLTQQDIASLICSSRQTVTSLFNTLKSEGVMIYDRKQIKIHAQVLKL